MIQKYFILIFTILLLIHPAYAELPLKLEEVQPRLVLADSVIKTKDALSVGDLGFTPGETESDLSQKDLNTRENMLQIHQVLGVLTAVPMTTEFILGLATASNVSNGNTDTSLHTTLGLATVALYGTAAAFEIFAPKPKHKKSGGNTTVHEDLAWIHLPLMIVVPLMGDMINDRLANSQPVGNLGAVHGTLATLLLVSYLSSITVITF